VHRQRLAMTCRATGRATSWPKRGASTRGQSLMTVVVQLDVKSFLVLQVGEQVTTSCSRAAMIKGSGAPSFSQVGALECVFGLADSLAVVSVSLSS